MVQEDTFEGDLEPLLTEDNLRAFVQAFLSHFGAFAIGGAIAVGVFAEVVASEFCAPRAFSTDMQWTACQNVGGLSTRIQLGLAAIALVTLLMSEVMSRRQHWEEGYE